MKLHSLFALVAMTAALAACGGGGSDSPAAPAPAPNGTPGTLASNTVAALKYVGTWSASCEPVTNAANGVLSAKVNFTFSSSSGATLAESIDAVGYKAANCAGSVFNTVNLGTATVTLNGTKTINAQTVDRLNIVAKSATVADFNGDLKDIGLISGNTVQFGATSTADADGYQTVLDEDIYTKQ